MRRSWVDSGALSAVPAVHYTAVDGRLRYRSAARLLPSQSLSSFAIPFDSRSPSLKGDILSLQLWGDIILEQEQPNSRAPLEHSACSRQLRSFFANKHGCN